MSSASAILLTALVAGDQHAATLRLVGWADAAIVVAANPAEVLAVDASLAYVEEAQHRLDDPRVRFDVANGASLDIGRALTWRRPV